MEHALSFRVVHDLSDRQHCWVGIGWRATSCARKEPTSGAQISPITVLFMGVISTMGITNKKNTGGTKFLLKKWKLCVWIILGCYSISIIQWTILLIDRVGPILTSLKTRKEVRIHNVVGFLTSSTIDLDKNNSYYLQLLLPYQSFSCCNCSIIIRSGLVHTFQLMFPMFQGILGHLHKRGEKMYMWVGYGMAQIVAPQTW